MNLTYYFDRQDVMRKLKPVSDTGRPFIPADDSQARSHLMQLVEGTVDFSEPSDLNCWLYYILKELDNKSALVVTDDYKVGLVKLTETYTKLYILEKN